LQHRNPDREAVAHFVNQLVFCFFADGVGLLPNGVWKKLLQTAERKPERSKQWLDQLFADMKDGGDLNLEQIAWFNGGLFDGRPALDLAHPEIGLLFAAASLDWSLIDPTIFGTLFERFLYPDKRAQIGAHYTDPDKIMMIVEPVVLRPLRAQWAAAKAKIDAIMAPVLEAGGGNGRAAGRELGKRFDAARAHAEAERDAFIDRLCAVRILDPACGSGDFLYLALQGVEDIEWRAILDCEALGLGMMVPRVGPEILHGLEINPFAAELVRTTIWIGDIQWRVKYAITRHPRPLLRKLDSIECRDALLAPDGGGGFVEAEWPEADFIIGNPPSWAASGCEAASATRRSRRCSRSTRTAFRRKRTSSATGLPRAGRRCKENAPGVSASLRRTQFAADRTGRFWSRSLSPVRSSRPGATSRGRSTAQRCGCHWSASGRRRGSAALILRSRVAASRRRRLGTTVERDSRPLRAAHPSRRRLRRLLRMREALEWTPSRPA
jgi:hypothetical protein